MNCPLTVSVSLQRGSEIFGALNQQNRRRHLMEQALQYAMRSQSASCPPLQQAIVRRSHPAQYGEDRFGPPTLERSGSEHRVGRFPPSPPEGERVGVRGGAFFNGKEGRDDFRKTALRAVTSSLFG